MTASPTSVPPVPQNKQPRNPISRRQVELVLSRSVAGFGIVFGAQTVPALLGQLDEACPLWLWIVVPALFGWLLVTLLLSIVQRWEHRAYGIYAVLYLAALMSWPFAIRPGVEIFAGIYWLNYLITVATAMAAIAFSTRIATVYLFLVPLVYSVIRTTPAGGGGSWQIATLEGMFAVVLGGAILILVTMLRQAASSVDAAQAAAVDRYGHAVRQHATEVERVLVDSIVHDSVLTTLLSAARAYTPEARTLAARMAHNAIGQLHDAAMVSLASESTLRVSVLADQIADTAATLSPSIELRLRRLGTGVLPLRVADTIHAAASQAMVNSLQHAGQAERWVSVRALSRQGVEVVVADTGAGFDMAVRSERLGVRVSIVERVANAGGRATVRSAPGEGTTVTIRWPQTTGAARRQPEIAEQGAPA